MKKYSSVEIGLWLIIIIAIVGSLVYAANRPPKRDVECTSGYVEKFGSQDCENLYESDDAKRQDFIDSRTR